MLSGSLESFQQPDFFQESLLYIRIEPTVIELKGERHEPEAFDPPVHPDVGSEYWAQRTTRRTEFDI